MIELGFGVAHPVKGRDFPVAIADSTPDGQSLLVVFERLLRLAPHVESASEVIECDCLALAITHRYSNLERALEIFDRLLLVQQRTVGAARMRECGRLCFAIADL